MSLAWTVRPVLLVTRCMERSVGSQGIGLEVDDMLDGRRMEAPRDPSFLDPEQAHFLEYASQYQVKCCRRLGLCQ